MPSISVIMPALNEEAALERAVNDVLASFEKGNVSGEILVINDGSSDQTASIADSLSQKYSNIRVIHHSTPHGIGASFWEGAWLAEGNAVTMLPGDGENESHEILQYLPLLQQVDIVIPFVYNREIRSLKRRLVSKLYKAIINASFGLLLNYMNGTVIYRRNVLLSLALKSRGFFFQTELLIKAIRRGYLYAEVPYALSQRAEGDSKALTLQSFLRLSMDYLYALKAVYLRKGSQDPLVVSSVSAQRRHWIQNTDLGPPIEGVKACNQYS